MSAKMFRAKARDLEQVSRNYDNAPACDVDPDDDLARRADDEDPSGKVTPSLPIRLVIRPRPARRRAA